MPRARIVFVGSQAEQFVTGSLGEFLATDPTGEHLNTGGMAAYSKSKMMMVLFTREMARRLALGEAKAEALREAALMGNDNRRADAPVPRVVDAICAHPGLVNSPLIDKTSPSQYPMTALLSRAGASLIGLTPKQGAASLLFAVTSPELDGKGGAFVGPSYITNLRSAVVREPLHPDARDPDQWRLCWEATARVLMKSFRTTGRVASRLQAVLSGHHRALPASA